MQIEDLHTILKVAKFRSITAAATHLDISTATASAAVKRVERILGADLFIRTTRQLTLSQVGERYIPQCEQALCLLDKAKFNMQNDLDNIDGELRIAISSDLGRNLLIPWIDEFMETHPKVSLRTHVSDNNIDFYRDAVDIALRYGSPNEANLYGFNICNIPRLLCATPSYLKKYGTPQHPHELTTHNGLCYQLHEATHNIWEFTNNDNGIKSKKKTQNNSESKSYKIKMSGNRISNDSDLVRRWCVAGKGLAVKSCLDMSTDLLAGNIVTVLPKYQPKPTELWLVCPSRQSITPAVRLLRDMLKEKSKEVLQRLIKKGLIDETTIYS
jgi:DNA-binding transcriptional LysR family regulator